MNALVPQHHSQSQGHSDALDPIPPFEGLTPLQSAFVRCYVSQGTGNATQAARDAGYAPSSAHAVGHRLLHHAAVRAAILSHTQEAFSAVAPVALARMLKLATQARSEFVQQQAAKDLLDRAGLAPPDKLAVAVKGEVSITINLDPSPKGG